MIGPKTLSGRHLVAGATGKRCRRAGVHYPASLVIMNSGFISKLL
jgi:hypothetical protein